VSYSRLFSIIHEGEEVTRINGDGFDGLGNFDAANQANRPISEFPTIACFLSTGC